MKEKYVAPHVCDAPLHVRQRYMLRIVTHCGNGKSCS
jgi:hypothetical protein